MAVTRDLHRLRSYQRASWEARQRGMRWFVEMWHRRGGKDRTWMAITCMEAMKRTGVYFHFLPTLGQARRDVWDNIITDKYDGVEHSYRMIDIVFPPEIRAGKINETELSIPIKSKDGVSIWQLMGAESQDAIDRARGPNPIGIVASEYAFMEYDPWKILSPVLLENGGWMAFISTPNVEGDNFDKLYKSAQNDPNWFSQRLTIVDTFRDAVGELGGPVILPEDVEEMRKHNITEEDIQREYYCNIKGYMHGTIYGNVLNQAEATGHIGRFPYRPELPVGVCLDLGHSDVMAVWFYQIKNNAVFFIDYWEAAQKDIKDVAHLLREQRRYQYGRIVLPWDGRSAANYLELAGFKNIEVCKRNRMEVTGDETASVRAQIDEVRLNFSRFYFDDTFNSQNDGGGVGLNHLRKYARERKQNSNEFLNEPKHDEHSHAADALRTGVTGGLEPLVFPGMDQWGAQRELKVETAFDLEKF